MKATLISAFVVITLSAAAADSLKTKPRIGYSFALHLGSLMGKQQATSAMGITHWFAWQRFARTRAGVGLGWENYEGWQTVPVSFQLQYDLSARKKNPWFFYGSVGRSWARRVPDYRPFNFGGDHGGRVYSFGLGKSIGYEKVELNFRIGQNVQRVAWEEISFFQPWFDTRMSDTYANRTYIEMTLRRVAVSVGLRWR